MANRVVGDTHVDGTLTANTLIPTDGTVTDAKVSGSASSPVDADKLEHIKTIPCGFGIDATAAPSADVVWPVYRARGAATIRGFDAILLDTGMSSDVKFDLLKSPAGSATTSTVLTGTLDFTNADTDNTAKSGTLSSSTLVTGDVLWAKMDYTSATGVLGPAVFVTIDEAAN